VEARPRVLVIDDDTEVRDSTVQLLAEAGYDVRWASNGVTALAELRGGYRPDVILADYRMAGMNGAEVIMTLHEDPDLMSIPTVLISDFARMAVAEMAGAAGYLKKPYYPTDLLAMVGRLVTGSLIAPVPMAPAQGEGLDPASSDCAVIFKE
jgi:CheY-like chemotaxis protein